MNSVVRQLLEQQTDVVMVDTGDSYEGICGYYGGTYISYSKEKPISMNPFKVTAEGIQAELRREEKLPQIAGVSHIQGQRISEQDRGHDSQPNPRGVLRCLFPSFREIHGEAACGVAAEAARRLQDGRQLREVQPRDGGHRPPDKRQGAAGGAGKPRPAAPLGSQAHEARPPVSFAHGPHARQGRLGVGKGTRRTYRGEIPQGALREHHAGED